MTTDTVPSDHLLRRAATRVVSAYRRRNADDLASAIEAVERALGIGVIGERRPPARDPNYRRVETRRKWAAIANEAAGEGDPR